MGRLRTFSGRELCELLAQHGYMAVRQRGSHVSMRKRVGDTTVTVPVPLHRVVATGTLLSIIRQSGLPRSLFEDEQ